MTVSGLTGQTPGSSSFRALVQKLIRSGPEQTHHQFNSESCHSLSEESPRWSWPWEAEQELSCRRGPLHMCTEEPDQQQLYVSLIICQSGLITNSCSFKSPDAADSSSASSSVSLLLFAVIRYPESHIWTYAWPALPQRNDVSEVWWWMNVNVQTLSELKGPSRGVNVQLSPFKRIIISTSVSLNRFDQDSPKPAPGSLDPTEDVKPLKHTVPVICCSLQEERYRLDSERRRLCYWTCCRGTWALCWFYLSRCQHLIKKSSSTIITSH